MRLDWLKNMADKSEMVINEGPFEDQLDNGKTKDAKRGNAQDRADMYRMGKVQELRVCLRLFTMILSKHFPSVYEDTDSLRTFTERLFKHYDLWIYHDFDCFVGSGTGVSAIEFSHLGSRHSTWLAYTDEYHSCSIMGLINGGTAGLIWMYLICWISFVFIYLSMAEMASM